MRKQHARLGGRVLLMLALLLITGCQPIPSALPLPTEPPVAVVPPAATVPPSAIPAAETFSSVPGGVPIPSTGSTDEAAAEAQAAAAAQTGPSTVYLPAVLKGGLVEVVSVRTLGASGAPKTSFAGGEAMRYAAVLRSTVNGENANYVISESGPCGKKTVLSGALTLAPGDHEHVFNSTAPTCTGARTYTLAVTHQGIDSSKSGTFTVQDKALRVLFVGNSFTFTNEMPTIFAALAEAGGHAVTAELTGLGGWSLQTHAGSPVTTAAIREGWDIVVLQEQSRIPAVEIGRTTRMYPAARTLDGLIKAAGAKTMFFLTWGYREGDPEVGLPSYVLMQDQLTIGYTRIADELGASIAPVGLAWKDLRAQANPPNLWSGDGEHPSLEGSYLSACVFYATIYQQSPVGLTVTAGLRQDQALRLQTAAANAVLGSPSGLPEDAGSGIGAQPEE